MTGIYWRTGIFYGGGSVALVRIKEGTFSESHGISSEYIRLEIRKHRTKNPPSNAAE